MKRRLGLQVLGLLVVSLAALFCLAGGVSHAQSGGGVGSGGPPGSGGSGSKPGDPGYAYSSYGWGWRIYDINSSGPRYGFRSGNWTNVQNTCRGYSTSVAVFVIDDYFHDQQGYDYHSVYYGPPLYSGYKTAAPYITVPAARAAYDALTVNKTGFTWGVNVGWFCYGVIPLDVCPNIAGNQASIPPGYIKDAAGNCVIPDQPATITVDVLNCTSNIVSGVALDGDWGGEIQVQIWVGGPPGIGAGYTVTTSGHRFTFNDPNPGLMRLAGQTYYARALGVNQSGTYNGVLTDTGPHAMGPCNSASCVLPSNFPTTMGVGETYYLKPQIRLDYAWGSPYTSGPTALDYNPTMHVTILNPAGTAVYDQDVKYDPGFPVPGTTLTANPTGASGDTGIPFTPATPGDYRLAWSLRGQLNINCTGVGDGYEHGDAGYKPFFSVTGGDIISGGGIRSWNRDNSGGAGYAGGGTTLAAIAAGDIQNFVTGGALAGGAAMRSGSALGFANTTASGTTYGGGFTVTPFTPVIGTTTNWGSGTLDLANPALADNTTYTHAGDLTLFGQLPSGKNITIVLTSGNLIIPGNTTYGAYATPSDIPRLTAIVQSGGIYVGSGVTEMHGVYSASGNFYSCSNATTPVVMSSASGYSDCNNRLVVYGAVAANQLVLTRTIGSYVAALAAEEFIYSPELWLAEGSSSSVGGGVDYSSYVTLPPVL